MICVQGLGFPHEETVSYSMKSQDYSGNVSAVDFFSMAQPLTRTWCRRCSSGVGAVLFLCAWAGHTSAQVPGIISHQGRLTIAGTNFNGVRGMLQLLPDRRVVE